MRILSDVTHDLDMERTIQRLRRELKLIRDNCEHIWQDTFGDGQQCERCFLARHKTEVKTDG